MEPIGPKSQDWRKEIQILQEQINDMKLAASEYNEAKKAIQELQASLKAKGNQTDDSPKKSNDQTKD